MAPMSAMRSMPGQSPYQTQGSEPMEGSPAGRGDAGGGREMTHDDGLDADAPNPTPTAKLTNPFLRFGRLTS